MSTSNKLLIGLAVLAIFLAVAKIYVAQVDSRIQTAPATNEPEETVTADVDLESPDIVYNTCSDKAVGDSCEFTIGEDVNQGQCYDILGEMTCGPIEEEVPTEIPEEPVTE